MEGEGSHAVREEGGDGRGTGQFGEPRMCEGLWLERMLTLLLPECGRNARRGEGESFRTQSWLYDWLYTVCHDELGTG